MCGRLCVQVEQIKKTSDGWVRLLREGALGRVQRRLYRPRLKLNGYVKEGQPSVILEPMSSRRKIWPSRCGLDFVFKNQVKEFGDNGGY